MDDFYTSMKETGIFGPQNNGNKGSSSSMLVDGLATFNPYKWPSFTTGSATASEIPDLQGKLNTPFVNIQVAQEYLATAQSDVPYRGRLWQFFELQQKMIKETLIPYVALEQYVKMFLNICKTIYVIAQKETNAHLNGVIRGV